MMKMSGSHKRPEGALTGLPMTVRIPHGRPAAKIATL